MSVSRVWILELFFHVLENNFLSLLKELVLGVVNEKYVSFLELIWYVGVNLPA